MAATAALVVAGLERGRGFVAAATVGVAAAILWQSYMDGLCVFPDAVLPPVLLAAALLLERFDDSGSRAPLRAGGLLLGLAVLVKQTSAWVALAALAWVLLRRKGLRAALELGAAIATPYALFAVLWGVAFRTTAHLYWTLIVPIFGGFAKEIRMAGGLEDVHEALAPFLAIPAVLLLQRALGPRRLSAAAALAVGTIGMAWPRSGLLHLSSAVGLVSLLAARAVLAAIRVAGAWYRNEVTRPRLAMFVAGVSLTVVALGVAVIGGGAVLADAWGGDVFYWNDPLTLRLEEEIRGRVRPGETLFLYNTNRDNLYARTRALTPDGLYVNSSFWYCFDRAGVDQRVTRGLHDFRGWILYREPDPDQAGMRSTELYRFLSTRTEVVAEASDGMTWRRVLPD
jgi:hypothetical protein